MFSSFGFKKIFFLLSDLFRSEKTGKDVPDGSAAVVSPGNNFAYSNPAFDKDPEAGEGTCTSIVEVNRFCFMPLLVFKRCVRIALFITW